MSTQFLGEFAQALALFSINIFLMLSLEKLQNLNSDQGPRPREAPPDPPSSIERTKLKGKRSV